MAGALVDLRPSQPRCAARRARGDRPGWAGDRCPLPPEPPAVGPRRGGEPRATHCARPPSRAPPPARQRCAGVSWSRQTVSSSTRATTGSSAVMSLTPTRDAGAPRRRRRSSRGHRSARGRRPTGEGPRRVRADRDRQDRAGPGCCRLRSWLRGDRRLGGRGVLPCRRRLRDRARRPLPAPRAFSRLGEQAAPAARVASSSIERTTTSSRRLPNRYRFSADTSQMLAASTTAPGGRPARRSRPVQGDQRHARPRCWRCPPPGGGHPAQGERRRCDPGPPRRRRVRDRGRGRGRPPRRWSSPGGSS